MRIVAADDEIESIAGAFDGPRALVHVGNETHWAVSPARAAAELEAHTRLAAHPLAAKEIERRGDVLVFPRSTPLDLADGVELLLPRGVIELATLETTPRAFFEMLGGPVDAVRALGRMELPRSRVDRFLGRAVTLLTPRGVDLGGVMPGALRRGKSPLAISLRYGRALGWPVMDLASLALRAEMDLSAVHTRVGGSDAAFDLALAHQALRELAAERDEARRASLRERVRSIVERFVPTEPSRVQLTVDAPSFLPASLFAPVGDVESTHARAILRDWEGLAVGGSVVHVRTEPALARPPRAFGFEPVRERRTRLFSRFDSGIAYDDEGLFSATPEALADRIAAGLSGIVVDATCGIGSIALALARSSSVRGVIAIDRNADRLRMAVHNAEIYGVRDRIDFRHGDALAIVATLAFDALVIDPPWGGREYDRERVTLEDLAMSIRPFLSLRQPIVLKLPRSFDVGTLPPGFTIEPAIDSRRVLKMLIARRKAR